MMRWLARFAFVVVLGGLIPIGGTSIGPLCAPAAAQTDQVIPTCTNQYEGCQWSCEQMRYHYLQAAKHKRDACLSSGQDPWVCYFVYDQDKDAADAEYENCENGCYEEYKACKVSE